MMRLLPRLRKNGTCRVGKNNRHRYFLRFKRDCHSMAQSRFLFGMQGNFACIDKRFTLG